MSTATAATLPDPKTAYDTLVDRVYAPAFFHRLAAHGLQPQTEKQAREYMELAGKLKVVAEDPRVKAAEAANDPVSQAGAALDGVMSRMGLNKSAAEQARNVARNQATINLASDPALYNAALSCKAAEVQYYLGQQQ